MPETFLILLAGGVMLAAAIPNPKDVTLQWLRLAAILALCFIALSICLVFMPGQLGEREHLLGFIFPLPWILGTLWLAHRNLPLAQRACGFGAALSAIIFGGCLIYNVVPIRMYHPFASQPLFPPDFPIFAGAAGIAALPGIALMDMLLGHAYLTASQLTMAPFRRLNLALGVAVIARTILSIGTATLIYARPLLEAPWRIYGLYILTRWLVGLLIPGIFVWMAHDCIKRRATQSATGILYVAGVLIFIGEIIALYLLRQTGLPF